ncbi:hypothetical protein KJ780_00285, partial [Candidatus Micrarchaeota archaeon]|nr:hypothetical protein [Candidatus Micrarchaeota archaeon]
MQTLHPQVSDAKTKGRADAFRNRQTMDQRPNYLVRTLFGNLMLEADERITVLLAGGHTSKLAQQIREGDRIPMLKNMIPKLSISQVGEALTCDERYR